MGTSGNRKGYKIFSFNTTIRNPERNIDFLKSFKKFDGLVMTNELLYQYYYELVKRGIYKFVNISESIKVKLWMGEELSNDEIIYSINNNPQKTGISGRVMTQLRALKDLGLLKFEKKESGNRISITNLGNQLIENKVASTAVYTKIFLGTHFGNPCRKKVLNKAIPFLNTIFVINEVNKIWKELGYEPHGIQKFEFGVFVLSMIDCDYKKTALEIVEYRKKFKYEINEEFISQYLNEKKLLDYGIDSIIKDYPDEVYRKFKMSGLLCSVGGNKNKWINNSFYDSEKINSIIEDYKNYFFKDFSSEDEYYDYLNCIELPWEKEGSIRAKIVIAKATKLGIFSYVDKMSLDELEEKCNQLTAKNILNKVIEKYDYDFLYRELFSLSPKNKEKIESKLKISDPLKLEYLLAILLGKRYGINGLVSNIIYDEDGNPQSFAPGKKADMLYYSNKGCLVVEATMIKSKAQQENNETTSVARHIIDEQEKTKLVFYAMLVAPFIHFDITYFFRYTSDRYKIRIIPISIDWVINLIKESETLEIFYKNYDVLFDKLMNFSEKEYTDHINNFSINLD